MQKTLKLFKQNECSKSPGLMLTVIFGYPPICESGWLREIHLDPGSCLCEKWVCRSRQHTLAGSDEQQIFLSFFAWSSKGLVVLGLANCRAFIRPNYYNESVTGDSLYLVDVRLMEVHPIRYNCKSFHERLAFWNTENVRSISKANYELYFCDWQWLIV